MNAILYTITGASNTPQPITGSTSRFSTAIMWGYKGFTTGAPQDNTNTIYIGLESGRLPIAVATGSYFNWSLQPSLREVVNNFWIRGASGDGVYIVSY